MIRASKQDERFQHKNVRWKISHGDEKKVQGTPSFRSGVYHRGTTYLHVVVHIQTGGNLIDPIDDRYFNLSSVEEHNNVTANAVKNVVQHFNSNYSLRLLFHAVYINLLL